MLEIMISILNAMVPSIVATHESPRTTDYAPIEIAKPAKLKLGMDKKDILAFFGEPDIIERKQGQEILHYYADRNCVWSNACHVVIENNKAVDFHLVKPHLIVGI